MSQLEPTPPPPQPRPHWTFVSVALFVLGLLIVIPSGLCTALFGIAALGGGGADLLGAALVISVPFLAVGAVLIFAGLNTRRRD